MNYRNHVPPGWAPTKRNAFLAALVKEGKRCNREWDEWDGTIKHGNAINDRQCDRIDQIKQRLNTPLGLAETD